MKITADTNVLLRAILDEEPHQRDAAREFLDSAELVAFPLPALCEFVWVLTKGYGRSRKDCAQAMRALLGAANVAVDRAAVEAGIEILDAGGDFADGVIAYEGARLGGEQFLSFDRKAVKLLSARGVPARLIG